MDFIVRPPQRWPTGIHLQVARGIFVVLTITESPTLNYNAIIESSFFEGDCGKRLDKKLIGPQPSLTCPVKQGRTDKTHCDGYASRKHKIFTAFLTNIFLTQYTGKGPGSLAALLCSKRESQRVWFKRALIR